MGSEEELRNFTEELGDYEDVLSETKELLQVGSYGRYFSYRFSLKIRLSQNHLC